MFTVSSMRTYFADKFCNFFLNRKCFFVKKYADKNINLSVNIYSDEFWYTFVENGIFLSKMNVSLGQKVFEMTFFQYVLLRMPNHYFTNILFIRL